MFDFDVLKELMKKTQISQRETAKAIGINYATFISYLKGREPSFENIIKIADYYAIPIDVFLGRCTAEQERQILENYTENFMVLRRAPYERYIVGRHKIPSNFIYGNYESPYPYNLLEDINNGTPIESVIKQDNIDGLNVAMKTLTEREEKCVTLYYQEGKALDEIAQSMKLTRERIRQIIAKALRKLRHPSRSRMIFMGLEGSEDLKKELISRMIELDKREAELLERETRFEKKVGEAELAELREIARKKIINKPIEELELSVRSFNCLKRNGINHISELIEKLNNNPVDVYMMHNLGKKSYEEILTVLDCYLKTNFYNSSFSIENINKILDIENM